jgi:hypothetical protein
MGVDKNFAHQARKLGSSISRISMISLTIGAISSLTLRR